MLDMSFHRGPVILTDTERAAATRAAHLAALERERTFYLVRGEEDNVAAVDAELARYGEPEDTAQSTPAERAIPPRRRREG